MCWLSRSRYYGVGSTVEQKVVGTRMEQIIHYIGSFFRYIGYRLVEGRGSRSYFQVAFRKFELFIDFKEGALENLAAYEVSVKHWRRRISFWLAFQEEVEIQGIEVNGKPHQAYKCYSVVLPIFNYRVNYLLIRQLGEKPQDAKVRISIRYKIVLSNSRSDLCTLLENSIFSDEFHLYNLWFPVLASCIPLREVFAGEIPEAHGSPFELRVRLSEPGDVWGEGKVTKLTPKEYVVEGTARHVFVCGGKLRRISYSSNHFYANFYYRRSLHVDEALFSNFAGTLFAGIGYILEILDNFDEREINIYCIPIIAGGYGLLHSTLINEDYVAILASHGNLGVANRLVWHEFIHYWWGNRISSVGPGKYLLTEGMTILFEWLTTREILGEDHLDLILHAAKEEVLEIRGFENTIAHANRVPPFGNVIIYKKAPLVLYQLLKMIGEDNFVGYCRAFLKKPGVYQWQDFLQGLEGYCGVDLEEYNSQWIYGREVPDGTEKEHIFLTDGRAQPEKDLDRYIAQWIRSRNDEKFCKQLSRLTPTGTFWNKYYYYAALCAQRRKDLMKAVESCEKIDEHGDLRYYLRGLFLRAQLQKQEGSMKASLATLDRILGYSYPINEALDLRQVFRAYRSLSV